MTNRFLKAKHWQLFLLVFGIPLVIQLTLMGSLIFYVAFFITSVSSSVPEPGDFVVIIPFHLFSVFCFFYAIYFAAKTLKTAEKQEKVSFSDFAGECVLMWFYLLGVWLLQPRIHRLVKEHTAPPETEGSGEGSDTCPRKCV